MASLDLGHQLQVMAIIRRYAEACGGVVMVMHDLNLTAHVAQKIGFVMNGRIAAAGPAEEVMTAERLGQAYSCSVVLKTAPPSGLWFRPQCCSLKG